jgi:hypothetical protein
MNPMNGEDHLRELLALEAVGALSDAERAELDAAIEDRPDLRDELESLRAAALTMADAVSEPPPAALRGRVLDAIATVPQEPALPAAAPPTSDPVAPVVPITAARSHRWVRWAAAAVAAAAVAIGVLIVSPFGSDDAGNHIADVLEDPNARTIELTGELTGLRLVHSSAADATVLEGVGVTPPDGDNVLELWRIAATVPEPVVREFRPEDDGSVAVLVEGLDPGDDVFAVTVEPAGGSDQPTSEPVAATA